MSNFLAAIGDQMGLHFVGGSIGENLLFDEHERSQDIMALFIGKVYLMYTMTSFVVKHIFDFVNYCCYSFPFINLESILDTDTREIMGPEMEQD